MLNFPHNLFPKFFYLYPIEQEVRRMCSEFSNTYIVCAFACCREHYDPEKYKQLVVAPTESEAEKMIEELKKTEQTEKEKYKLIDKETYIKKLE